MATLRKATQSETLIVLHSMWIKALLPTEDIIKIGLEFDLDIQIISDDCIEARILHSTSIIKIAIP
jgi:hypothetical protein